MNRKPNILFILSDQHRFCDVGYAGNHFVETPNLDQMAREGAFFTTAVSNCPLCVPARGTILTGLHALQHKAAANDMPVDPGAPSIARILQAGGYQTGYIGKWHLAGVPRDRFVPESERLGFEFWNGYNCNHSYFAGFYDDNENNRQSIDGYEPIGITQLAMEYIDDRVKKNPPWALYLNFGTPHDPYDQLPAGDLERELAKNVPLRENICEPLQDLIQNDETDLRKMTAGYYAHIRQLDIQIGQMRNFLRDAGELDNTIIIYTSDHGDMLGSHGYLNKQLYFNESARVPFVITWPGFISGGERRSPISLADVLPTILGLIGLPSPESIAGNDQSSVLLDSTKKGQQYVYFYSYIPCHQALMRNLMSWRAVTDGRYVCVADETGAEVAFYDNLNDPLQMNNLITDASFQSEKSRLRQVLDTYVQRYDGYRAWDELLDCHGLLPAWDKSQQHFSELWHARIPSRRDDLIQAHQMMNNLKKDLS